MLTSKLAALRRKKGLSQEQLSNLSGISVRTIQRIEKGIVEAHVTTIKILADCLEVDVENLLGAESSATSETVANANKLSPAFHALALAGMFFPVLNIILPGVLWLIKKDDSINYDFHGKQVVNFQLTMSFFCFPAILLMIYYFPLGFPLFLLLYFYAITMSLINLFKSIKQQPTRYPFSYIFFR